MATTADPAAEAAPKKKRLAGLTRVLFIILAFAAGAVAGGFGAAIGVAKFGGGGHEAPPPAAAPVVAATEYVEIDQAFTSNLVDTGRYLQIRLSLSTSNGPTVLPAVAKHKPALVSAVLSVLGEMGEADVADRAAKDKLRARLKDTINQTLKANGTIGTIDDVFFTSLVIQ
ncbi:MAG: hypothetical protein RL490_1750 [Pseudomonadota bacterium]|jgi:flagellar FliL protein